MNEPKYRMLVPTLPIAGAATPMPLVQNQPISVTVGPKVQPVPEPEGPQPLPAAPSAPGTPSALPPATAGGTYTVQSAGSTDLARWVGSDEHTFTVYTRATGPKGLTGDRTDQRKAMVMLSISWGTDRGQQTMIVPAGREYSVSGTTCVVTGFMANRDGSPVQGGMTSTVQSFIAIGASNVYPTKWLASTRPISDDGANLNYQSTVSTTPCNLRRLIGTNHGDAEGTLLVYDCEEADPDDLSVHNDYCLLTAIVPAGAAFSFDFINDGCQFFNGLIWVVSSSRTNPTRDTAALFHVNTQVAGL